ncbi:MAG: tRNA pseudouridine(55) synthase TruB [Chloroflexi bacterium]|nr:MAG: tRNA pseudouridine(55) synthase TruB [Chloroflexota bacterium]
MGIAAQGSGGQGAGGSPRAHERPRVTSGILNVNKPAGPSSFAVVRTLRRLPGVLKAGHGGTLDPAAEGVLPILVNGATRIADFVHEWPKTYVATVTFGFTSDTGDREGTIVAATDPEAINRERIEAALPKFTGRIEQVPPLYSALKQGGEALYRKARRGEAVERRARVVEIFSIRLLDYDSVAGTARIEVNSGRGMYVRSLAQDLGAALGSGAYLSALVRTAIGPLTEADAVPMATLAEAGEGWTRWLLPMDLPLRRWPAVALDAAGAAAVRRGLAVPAPDTTGGRYRLLGPDGELVAWGEADATRRIQPRAVFSV